MFQLRLLDTVREYTIADLPVQFQGTTEQCNAHATEKGYLWMRRPGLLFGGYFSHPESGNCLFPDTITPRTTRAKSDCGRAGQPGYVFRIGDSVIVSPATNLPQGGFFVAKSDNPENSVHVDTSDIGEFVE